MMVSMLSRVMLSKTVEFHLWKTRPDENEDLLLPYVLCGYPLSFLTLLKPGYSSYYPIALTFLLFQKILNKRLFWFPELNSILSSFQYGFCKCRNTFQSIPDLNLRMEGSLKNNASLYTIFVDIREAFTRIWCLYIRSKLFEIGLRGNLPSLLQSFLHDKFITVRIQNIYSIRHLGVAQGEIWSVPFLLIAINDLTDCISFALTRRLFADNFNVFLPPQFLWELLGYFLALLIKPPYGLLPADFASQTRKPL